MSISEEEIRNAALYELSIAPNGKRTTTDLIDILTEKMKPTGKDAEIADGRADTYFSQKVRNLVSHRDLRPDFPPAFGRIRRLVSGLMRPSFPVSI